MDFAVCFPTVAQDIADLKTALQESKALQEEQAKTIEDLSTRLATSEEEKTKLIEEVGAVKEGPIVELETRIKVLEEFDVDTLKTAFSAQEEKFPGVGFEGYALFVLKHPLHRAISDSLHVQVR